MMQCNYNSCLVPANCRRIASPEKPGCFPGCVCVCVCVCVCQCVCVSVEAAIAAAALARLQLRAGERGQWVEDENKICLLSMQG